LCGAVFVRASSRFPTKVHAHKNSSRPPEKPRPGESAGDSGLCVWPAADRVRAIRPICLTPAESRFAWRVPEQIRFVWHAKRKKAGIRHAKRKNLGIRPRQAGKGGISATQSAKRQDFSHTKREKHDGICTRLAFSGPAHAPSPLCGNGCLRGPRHSCEITEQR
jgi:hypothetical protein